MKVKDIMSPKVVSVKMDASLREVKYIFEHTHFHHLMVTTSGKLIGIISDRDLLKAISPKVDTAAATDKDLATLNKRAHQIMTREPICMDQNASFFDAVDVFDGHKISCIPVIDENKKPVGVVSWRDVIKVIKQRNDLKKRK